MSNIDILLVKPRYFSDTFGLDLHLPVGLGYIARIENAVLFNIEPTDIYNSGREFTSSCGIVIPEGELMMS